MGPFSSICLSMGHNATLYFLIRPDGFNESVCVLIILYASLWVLMDG